MTFLFVCLLAGLLLGQRFKVLVLVPAAAVVLALSFAGAETHWPIALTAVAAMICLQIGYLLGLGLRHVLSAVFPAASSLLGSTSPRRTVQ